MADVRGEVTGLLAELRLGRKDALDRLLPLVYRELRRIAGNQMRNECRGHSLQPTALVHELFFRLVDQSHADSQHRTQFLAVSAQLMRRDQILARLSELDSRQARVVELRYFGGLTVEETAEAMGIATRTVKLDWAMAKAWMQSRLSPQGRL